MSTPYSDRPSLSFELVRYEEELRPQIEEREYANVRARKRVESEHIERTEHRSVEHGDVERSSVDENDSGEIEVLEDGSVSIPLLEERLVVRRETFVRERVILRKRTVTETERIDADLRKERIEIDGAE
jgi:uncharacterized protein (TIGR02271 family)